jgi:hypothetical protein
VTTFVKGPALPRHLVFRTVALVAVVAFAAGCLAAVSQAQEPTAAPQRTLVAVGAGLAKVTPKDRNANASIVAAIEAAEQQALPRAVADGRSEAQALATAAGVTLGTLVSVSNNPTVAGPFYGPYYGSTYGSFGPNQFCGTIRVPVFKQGADGKRHRTGTRSRRVCRFPSTLQRTVQLTYALA